MRLSKLSDWINPDWQVRVQIFCYVVLFIGLILILLGLPEWFVPIFAAPGALNYIVGFVIYGYQTGKILTTRVL